jgi:SAM-dependent methyltransferase
MSSHIELAGASRYVLAAIDGDRRDFERARLEVLHAATGPWATRILRDRGLAAGWACADVGAGAGHLARWLAEQVGPDGRVVATDIETGFLDELEDPAVEVRDHDILTGPVEAEAFDLVVARAVVVHLRDRAAGLANLARSVRPGGWLVVIDPSLPAVPDVRRAADPELHDRVFRLWNDLLVDAGAAWDASVTVSVLDNLGFEAGGEGLSHVLGAGDATTRLWALTCVASAQPLVERGEVTWPEIDRVVAMMDEPGYRAYQSLGFASWGRRR